MNKAEAHVGMKVKDWVGLGLLALILIVLGSFLVGHFGGGAKQRTAQIEVVSPIDATFDSAAEALLRGQNAAVPAIDFALPLDPSSGLGNDNLFGP